jgi:hypothetical protein
MKEVGIKSLEIEEDKINMTLVDPNGTLQCFVNEMVSILKEVGGVNYCGWTVVQKETGEQYEFLIQKKTGKTPSEMVAEAKKLLEGFSYVDPDEPMAERIQKAWKVKEFLGGDEG